MIIRFLSLSYLLISLISPLRAEQPLPPGGIMAAPFGPGGTWNIYQRSEGKATWTAAQTLAAVTKDPAGGTDKFGHLVTIGSGAENLFAFHFSGERYLWIGLTDSETYGGKEAGSDRNGKWVWVNGEPLTWSAWRSPEPNEIDPAGEDCVAMEASGRWADWGNGADGQGSQEHGYMIEWDTHLKEPPAGIRRLEKILPDKWPVDLAAWNGPVEGKAEGGWTIFGTIGAELGGDFDATSIWSVAGDLQAALSKEQPQIFRLPRLNYRWPGRPERAGGWLKIPDRPLHPCVEGPCGALQVATVHVEKPGPWSVNVHCDDFVAVRFRGLRWKSCTGLGGIDPLDPETLFFSLGSGDGCAIGVIDLPAGDHQLEVLTGNQIFEVMTQLTAAPGVHLMEGATDQWRDPGHKAAGELAWPGVDEKGWTVNRVAHSKESPPGSLLDAFALAEDGGVETKDVPQIHFIDTGGAGDVEFPDPKPFPGDVPGQEDHFVIHATATLVIPSDGLYHIGIHAEDRCAIGIEDQTWKRIIRDTGYLAKIAGDVIMEDDTDWVGTNAQIVGEIELKKGTYTIQVLYWDHSGTSTLSVFGSPAGFAPRLITKDGAKMEPDVDGLPFLQRK